MFLATTTTTIYTRPEPSPSSSSVLVSLHTDQLGTAAAHYSTNQTTTMLMTAALRMDSAHGHGPSPSSSTPTSPPPWLPLPTTTADNHRRQLLCDFAASAPSPTPATAAPPDHHHHHHLRPTPAHATRRVSKRRPRPSRKLPTTYITADPASFRRMVHQVTGADHLPPPGPPSNDLLCRPAPTRAGAAAPGPGALMLPTLDTSAFLLGAPGVPAPCVGSAVSPAAAALIQVETDGAGGACNYSSNSGSSCGGFPTLDSWDALF